MGIMRSTPSSSSSPYNITLATVITIMTHFYMTLVYIVRYRFIEQLISVNEVQKLLAFIWETITYDTRLHTSRIKDINCHLTVGLVRMCCLWLGPY